MSIDERRKQLTKLNNRLKDCRMLLHDDDIISDDELLALSEEIALMNAQTVTPK